MKPYRFRLERLLEIRRYHEQQWELKLAAATGECARVQNEIDSMDRARRTTLAGRFDAAHGDIRYIAASELYMRRLDANISRNRRVLAEKERARDAVRAEYLVASRDRQVLDKLKERRADQYRREKQWEEAELLDDIGGSASARSIQNVYDGRG